VPKFGARPKKSPICRQDVSAASAAPEIDLPDHDHANLVPRLHVAAALYHGLTVDALSA
jgi:hypothetical protein